MRLQVLLLMVAAPFSTLSAALYVPDLTGTSPGDPLEGVDGWMQSESNPAPDEPLAFISEIGGSPGAAVGGFYAEPSGDSFVAFRPINSSLAGSMLSLKFGIQNSTSEFPDRNDFSIGLSNGTTNLFSLAFLATSVDGLWNAFVTSDAAASSPAFGAVGDNAIYTLNVGFTPNVNTTDMDYDLSLVGNVGVPFTKSGTLTGLAGAEVENFNLGFSKGLADGYGDNFLVIEGTARVPDTGSTLALFGLSLAALLKFGKSAKRSDQPAA